MVPFAVIFLLFAAVAIAAYFYLMRAHARDDARKGTDAREAKS